MAILNVLLRVRSSLYERSSSSHASARTLWTVPEVARWARRRSRSHSASLLCVELCPRGKSWRWHAEKGETCREHNCAASPTMRSIGPTERWVLEEAERERREPCWGAERRRCLRGSCGAEEQARETRANLPFFELPSNCETMSWENTRFTRQSWVCGAFCLMQRSKDTDNTNYICHCCKHTEKQPQMKWLNRELQRVFMFWFFLYCFFFIAGLNNSSWNDQPWTKGGLSAPTLKPNPAGCIYCSHSLVFIRPWAHSSSWGPCLSWWRRRSSSFRCTSHWRSWQRSLSSMECFSVRSGWLMAGTLPPCHPGIYNASLPCFKTISTWG